MMRLRLHRFALLSSLPVWRLGLLTALLAFSVTVPRAAHGQIDLSTSGVEVSKDFDDFRGDGFAPTPSSGQLNSNAFIAKGLSNGDMEFGDVADSLDFARGESVGGEATGGIYAFDIATDNYSLGVQPGGDDFTSGTFVVQYENKTGNEITKFDLSYDIGVFNDEERANSFNSAYTSGACGTAPSEDEFTVLSDLNFTSPEASDSNPSWEIRSRSTTVSGVSISDGECIFIQFRSDDASGSGSRDELALNNLDLTPTPDVTPVAVQFSSATGTINEADSTSALTVEISNPDGNEVDVDVTFDDANSSTDQADFTSSFPSSDTTTTVTFPSNASDGDTKTLNLDLNQNDGAEGREAAQFVLENLSSDGNAFIDAPSHVDLAVEDDVGEHNGDLLITELMPAPSASDEDAEYIELYNATLNSINLGAGWTLDVDGDQDESLSATIPPRGSVVLCRDDDVAANGGIRNCNEDYVDEISLVNGGSTVQILDPQGNVVDEVTYTDSNPWPENSDAAIVFTGTTQNNDGANWTTTPRRERGFTQDGSGSGDPGSPGRTGAKQSLQPTAEITGGAGWRMLSAPVAGVNADTLAKVSLVQGVDGHFPNAAANLYRWPGGPDSGTDWDASFSADEDLTGGGQGYIWYVFDTAQTKFTDTPPFTLGVPGVPRTNDVTTGSLGEGFHLLGTPYGQSFDPASIEQGGTSIETGGTDFNTTVQVYDPADGNYDLITAPYTADDFLSPYQGFFVEKTTGGTSSLTFDAGGRRIDPIDLKTVEDAPPRIEFRLVGQDEDGSELTRDEALLLHAPDGATPGWDVHDASKLTPLAGRYATAAFRDSVDGKLRLQSVSSIPSTLPEEGIELPLSLQLQGTAPLEVLQLSWPTWTNVPDGWSLALHDAVSDSTINLRVHTSYAFTLPTSKTQSVPSPRSPLKTPKQIRTKAQSDSARFTLTVHPNPIPVELARLNATAGGETARLTWTTASETNNAGFHVEHRGPEGTQFTSVGFVEGHGTTNTPQRYRFHTNPLDPGRHVFRLRQMDLDGTATRSDTVAVQVRLKAAAKVAVAPNPVQSRAEVSVRVREKQSVTIALYDVLGRRVRTVHEGPLAPDRAHALRVDAETLSSGLYLLRANGDQFQKTRRITVVR